jgi:RHS repeat-associated protein
MDGARAERWPGWDYYLYGPAGTPIEQIAVSGGATSYLLSDQLGSVRAITNSSGAVTGTETYDAWGNSLGTTGTINAPFGFAGEYLDPSNGLYYLQARWYDPATGKFLSLDPAVIQTSQPYLYAGGDPLNESDPSGQLTLAQILAASRFRETALGSALVVVSVGVTEVELSTTTTTTTTTTTIPTMCPAWTDINASGDSPPCKPSGDSDEGGDESGNESVNSTATVVNGVAISSWTETAAAIKALTGGGGSSGVSPGGTSPPVRLPRPQHPQ